MVTPSPIEKTARFPLLRFILLGYCLLLLALAFWWDDPAHIWAGLKAIVFSSGTLLTDYMALAGIGAAFVNSAVVLLIFLAVLTLARVPMNGSVLLTFGLMAGFSLFGKNIFNLWPILFGGWLSAKIRKVPFRSCATVVLMASTLGPLVSFLCLSGTPFSLPLGLGVGILIGLVVPALTGHTAKMQGGLNLYNVGFACGLTALVLTPLLHAMGYSPAATAGVWATGLNGPMGLFLGGLSLACILAGLFCVGPSPREALGNYLTLLKATGRSPCDFLRDFGGAAVLLNTGVNGLLGTGYILAIGGDLNGPTVGAILTIMGFSAAGKHARNLLPIMAGVFLGGLVMQWNPTDPGAQIAALFGTTLAPVAGVFGWPAGVLTGFLHGSVVLRTGGFVGGVNLYNNGFSGGLIATLLFPILSAFFPDKEKKEPAEMP